MPKPEAAGSLQSVEVVTGSWQAALKRAREQLSRQVGLRNAKDATPDVLLNLLKLIYIRERGDVKRKTWGHCGVSAGRRGGNGRRV
jgi:hypothetical protein